MERGLTFYFTLHTQSLLLENVKTAIDTRRGKGAFRFYVIFMFDPIKESMSMVSYCLIR